MTKVGQRKRLVRPKLVCAYSAHDTQVDIGNYFIHVHIDNDDEHYDNDHHRPMEDEIVPTFLSEFPPFPQLLSPCSVHLCADDSSLCMDFDPSCPMLAQSNFCENSKFAYFMSMKCKKSCKMCATTGNFLGLDPSNTSPTDLLKNPPYIYYTKENIFYLSSREMFLLPFLVSSISIQLVLNVCETVPE